MLKIGGKEKDTFCDGLTRRNFLQVGALGVGGLTLPQLLRAESASGRSTQKAVINIFLPGGPPHQDMWDIKSDAPSEIRGEFSPIRTNVPGIQIGEMFPRMARMMDKFTIIRSMVGSDGRHDAFQCMTGRSKLNQPAGDWPALGPVLSKVQGAARGDMPASVGLAPEMGEMRWADPGRAGFLGTAHNPFQPNGAGQSDMVLNGVSVERLRDRERLLTSFDNFRRDVDQSGAIEGMDAFNRQAFETLTSGRLAEALNLDAEDSALRDRYGRGSGRNQADGGPKLLDQFLMARRLVEAGARCVTLAFSRWDWHSNNFKRARQDMPMLDQGITALVQDLHDRGLDKDVTVVVWGEFGRTPKINSQGGRDHWPRVSCALLAGGGMNHGQVIGATDRLGGEAVERPVRFGDVFSTLYHNLGIDTSKVTIPDLNGRPRYLVDNGCAPIRELVG